MWAGVRAALGHICELHALREKDRRELVASVENECASDFRNSEGASCAVIIDEMEDRVEVRVASTKESSGKINSREAHAAKRQDASRAEGNGDAGKVFVKHFQKNTTHS